MMNKPKNTLGPTKLALPLISYYVYVASEHPVPRMQEWFRNEMCVIVPSINVCMFVCTYTGLIPRYLDKD